MAIHLQFLHCTPLAAFSTCMREPVVLGLCKMLAIFRADGEGNLNVSSEQNVRHVAVGPFAERPLRLCRESVLFC